MDKLIVVDYDMASIDIYNLSKKAVVNNDLIKRLGFNPDRCEWMISTTELITCHKGVLK